MTLAARPKPQCNQPRRPSRAHGSFIPAADPIVPNDVGDLPLPVNVSEDGFHGYREAGAGPPLVA